MSKLLVTGAQGFAGGYLTKRLAESGYDVAPMTRSDVDLLDREATIEYITDQQPDGIFHLAAPHTSVAKSWEEPGQTVDENLGTTLSILEAARLVEPAPRVLFISSSEVVGEVSPGEMTEEVEPKPQSPYALSKYLGEKSCRFYFERFRTPIIIARAFNHIGPGQKENFVFPSFAAQIAQIEAGPGKGSVRVGNLEAERDFVDVRDMVEAYVVLMEKGLAGDIYHAGLGKTRPVRSVLDLMISMSDAEVDVIVDRARFRPNNIPVSKNDSTKLRDLGWQPKIEMEETVAEIMDEARARAVISPQ